VEKLTDQRNYYSKKFHYQYALINSVTAIKESRLKKAPQVPSIQNIFSARLMNDAYIHIYAIINN